MPAQNVQKEASEIHKYGIYTKTKKRRLRKVHWVPRKEFFTFNSFSNHFLHSLVLSDLKRNYDNLS